MTALLDSQYQRLQAEVGKERSERLGVVARRDLERFAFASHAPLPQPGSDGSVVAHPLFLSSVMGWGAGPPEEELDTDGTAASDTRGLPLEGVRLMGAGQELEFHAMVHDDTNVVVHTTLTDLEMKHGRSGAMLVLRILRRFTDEAGRALVSCHESFIAR